MIWQPRSPGSSRACLEPPRGSRHQPRLASALATKSKAQEGRDTRAPEDRFPGWRLSSAARLHPGAQRLVRSWRIASGSKGDELVEFWFPELAAKRRACEGGRENTVGEGLYRGGNRLA